jgi:hypothetical protein
LQEQFDVLPAAAVVARPRDIQNSVDAEFAEDPVVQHPGACADELERIELSTKQETS